MPIHYAGASTGTPGTFSPNSALCAPEVEAEAAAGDLSAWFGQQIPFNQIVALGALKKSGSVYVQNNGYTEGTVINS